MASQINGPSMIAIGVTLPALSIIAVCSRFYIRVSHKQGLRADDWLILLSLFMVIGMGIVIIIGAEQHVVGFPAGTNDFNFLNWSITFIEQLEFAVYLLSLFNLAFSKLSLVYFYRRVFYTGFNKNFDIFTKILVGTIVLWTIGLGLTFIFNCGSDIAIHWGSYADILQHCSNTEVSDLFWPTTDVIFDLILFAIPIPLILRLKLSSGRRLAILLVFAVGALAVVTSIVRLVISGLIYNGQQNDFVGGDPIIVISLFFYWSMFEGGIAIIATCLPVLQIWFRKISVDAVTKNVLGIFSIQSLSRGSHRSGPHSSNTKDVHSSVSNLNDANESVELDELSQHQVHDIENQTQRD